LQERPGLLVPVRKYYADNPADFITDWANTFNPLNPGQGLPTTLPFVLFERQREWIDYVLRKWHARERGLTEKSREVGMSWLAIGLSCTMCLFNREFVVGFGSYKKEYVDEAGSPSSLFWKARFFIEHLPVEFRGSRHAPQLRSPLSSRKQEARRVAKINPRYSSGALGVAAHALSFSKTGS
jgi:phage terminase large subunit